MECFNTQPPEGGWAAVWGIRLIWQVSTHSRPKAAGNQHCFTLTAIMFQHTAARRRLGAKQPIDGLMFDVSTHSRPKAAGSCFMTAARSDGVSTHSRPKAAGEINGETLKAVEVSTHSRPKAAGKVHYLGLLVRSVSTHSRPKAAGAFTICFNWQ